MEKDIWEWKPLKYLFNYTLSSVDRKIKDEELNVHICHYPDVYKNEKISNKDNLNRGTCTELELENFKLKKGDILITKDSEDPTDIGIPCLIKNDLINSVCGYHIGILRTNENLEREFYFRYIQSACVKDYFFCESNGITRFGLGKSSVENLKIPILSIKEQKLIKQYLNQKTQKIDILIKKIEKKIELLNEQKIVMIDQYVTKGIDPNIEIKDSGVDSKGEVPKNWRKTRLKYLVKLISGFAFKSNDYQDHGIQLIKIGNLYQNRLQLDRSPNFLNYDFSESYKEFLIQKNDLLISLTGTLGKRDYGFVCKYLHNKPSLLNQRVGKIVTTSKEIIEDFVFYYMRSEFYQSQIFKKPKGTKQGNFSSEDILSNTILLPKIEIQKRIVKHLSIKESLLNKLIKLHDNQIKKLKEYRQSLISSVVTGKIRITEDMI